MTPDDITREQAEKFLANLAGRKHDRYYQDIELPYGMSVKGYERKANTWATLSTHINFAGKTFLDAGCYHGYCLFKAEKAGAIVEGLDINTDALDTVRELADLYGSKARFIHSGIDDWKPDQTYDIVLCSNVIHHTKDRQKCIAKLFSCGDLVIFEAQGEFAPIFAAQKTHKPIRILDTARTKDLKRRMYFYERI